MRLIHTSDWHLGRPLLNRKRYEEFEQFLDWLAETIVAERVDVLLVAGDVFNNSVPSNRAQELYYRFLKRVADSACHHVVIVAGNHDSPSFLDAPRELLRILDVHVVGAATSSPDDEVLVLEGKDGGPGLIVCAVPYLRDRDVRTVDAGESLVDKDRKQAEGIRDHYLRVATIAEETRSALGGGIPIVAMGHLFVAGGKTVEEDGVRDLYVGSLAKVGGDAFPPFLDYLALGHLHVPQMVNDAETRRYSGSPLPMGFGEGGHKPEVLLVEFSGTTAEVTPISVPRFRELESIRGDWKMISAQLTDLKAKESDAWIEVVYDGADVIGNLQGLVEEAVAGTSMELLRVRDSRLSADVLERMGHAEMLEDLGEEEVFKRLLTSKEVPEAQREELLMSYRDVVRELHEEDANAK